MLLYIILYYSTLNVALKVIVSRHFVWLSCLWDCFAVWTLVTRKKSKLLKYDTVKEHWEIPGGQRHLAGQGLWFLFSVVFALYLRFYLDISVFTKFWLRFKHRLLPTWTMPRSRPCMWSVWPTPASGSRGRCVSAPSTSWVSSRIKRVC